MLGWIPEEALSWKHIKDDIVILLNHSDCDGEITAEECLKVAPRLRHLVEDWHEDDFDKEEFLKLAEGMELAAANGEPLNFH